MNQQRHLVLFDADRITGYVFDTGRLKEIRGGSSIVRQATNRAAIETLARDVDSDSLVIFAGGGAGLVRFSDSLGAQAFVQALQRSYREKTVSGTLTAVAAPYPPGQFAAALHNANRELRRSKESYPQHDHQAAANPFTAICVSCGRRPVGRDYAVTTQRSESLCAACWQRRQANDALHRQAQTTRSLPTTPAGYSITLEDLKNNGDRLAEAMLRLSPDPAWNDAWMPDELDDIGLFSRPRNYLGFVHADGNQVGEHLRRFTKSLPSDLSDEECERRYGQFSQAIADATVGALAAALHHAFPMLPRDDGERFIPFDNVLLAGDDMILIIAAHKALDVVIAFCDGFADRMAQAVAPLDYHQPITTSAGVVLANSSQPILYLQHHAKELLQRAKQRNAQPEVATAAAGIVDFTVVTTPVLRSLPTIRSHEYSTQEADRKLVLTRRPYVTRDLADLLDLGRRLKGLVSAANAPSDPDRRSYPRSQLHALYDAIFLGYHQASLQGARASLRVNAYQHDLLEAFARRFASNDPLPWGPAPADTEAHYATAFTDLVELYDFLHSPEAKEASDA